MKWSINIPCRRLVAGFAALLLPFATACEQDYELELPLAVTQNALNLDPSGGQTHVLVYATGSWTASFAAETPWAEIREAKGEGNGAFVFVCEMNPGIDRKTDVVIRSGSREQVVKMIQKGFVVDAEVTLLKQSMELPCWAGEVAVGLKTNLGLALERFETRVEYLDDEGNETTTAQPWISDIRVREDSVYYTVAANTAAQVREARLTLLVRDEVNEKEYASTATVSQSTEEGFMRFEADAIDVESFARTNTLPWTTNLTMFFPQVVAEVTYDDGAEAWITNVVCGDESVTFDTAENTTRGIRTAALRLTYADRAGHSVTASQRITQARPALDVPFDELRSMLPAAGELVLERDFIVGTIISEPGNANLETNSHVSWTEVDYSVNAKTAYIQSEDGRYGLRIRTESPAELETLTRFATVKIALAGLTLTREEAPVRYTLSGFTAASILDITPGQQMPVRKEKSIAELTDEDLYTFVSLREVEFALDRGAYGNMHEGYALKSDLIPGGNKTATRCDCMPRTLRDRDGGTINMLVNSQVPWRRPGHRVPQGSGTASGILVHSSLLRYGPEGDIGRYQLRPLTEEDLAIHETEGFSGKLVEWEWSSPVKTESGSKSRIVPTLGKGTMDTTAELVAGSETGRTANWLGLSFASYAPNTAARYNGKWWNFTKNEGESIFWTFSTADITGPDRNLTLVFAASVGNMGLSPARNAPLYWNVEYSTDGVHFTTLREKIVIYPSPVFAYTKMDIPAGNAEYVFSLPDALCGQPSVTVRIKAADTIATTMNGLTAGTIKKADAAAYLRFDAVIIKYNK